MDLFDELFESELAIVVPHIRSVTRTCFKAAFPGWIKNINCLTGRSWL